MDSSDNENESPQDESLALTQTYLLTSLRHTQLSDLVASTSGVTASQRALLARLALDVDKTLLQMLAVECREGGEERGMRALEVVRLMRDTSGRMVEAAVKIAERYGRGVLGGKIRELALEAGDEDDEFED